MSEKWSAKGNFQQFTDLILWMYFIHYPDLILRCCWADMVLDGCIFIVFVSLISLEKSREIRL